MVSNGVHRWRLSGFGEHDGRYWVGHWRFGKASKGESRIVTRERWYATFEEQQKAIVEDPEH